MSWGLRNENTLDYKSVCYIAKKLEPIEDEYGNEIPQYGKPTKYFFNIQPVTNTSETSAFGDLVPRMKVAMIPRHTYKNVFKEFDLAYLDDVTPENEKINGTDANYRIYSIQPQNVVTKIYFLKIIKGEEY